MTWLERDAALFVRVSVVMGPVLVLLRAYEALAVSRAHLLPAASTGLLLRALLAPMPLAPFAAPPAPADTPRVEIIGFRPEHRTRLAGDDAVSELVLRNRGPAQRRLWVGYSVQGPDDRWFDVAAHALVLRPGENSGPQRKSWRVPAAVAAAGGRFRVVMAVWTAPPGTPGAQRLAMADRRDAFRVRGASWPLADEPDGPWRAASHALGRGRFRPDQVLATARGFRLRLTPGSCDGAEIRSRERVGFGEHTARMRTPRAPGSLSALFLYEDVRGGNDEIDIEIHNDGSRRVLLTAWRAGKAVHESVAVLPFDPSAAAHDYTIRWTATETVLLVDGVPLERWTTRYPRRPMHLMVNVWYPTWLECDPPSSVRELVVEWIRSRPASAASAP